MKATGFVRGVDKLGRLVLPIEVRRELDIEPKDDMEILVDGESIVIQKYVPGCIFCGEREGLTEFKGKIVCSGCAKAIENTYIR